MSQHVASTHLREVHGTRGLIKNAVARGFAFFLGGFSLLNVLGKEAARGFDANIWWIDLRFLLPPTAELFLIAVSVALLTFATFPRMAAWRRWLTLSLVSFTLAITLENGIQFYVLLSRGDVRAGIPVPFSFLVSGLLFIVCQVLLSPPAVSSSKFKSLVLPGSAFVFCLAAFPLVQLLCFGKTDYRRHADAIVVFGARTYANGRPSDALSDRVRTACHLYSEGLAKKLIFSGGPGDGPVHETDAMRQMALTLGVPTDDIVLDRAGLNTQETVRNTCALFRREHIRRVLAVSHFYHLPRIKLTYQREGFEVYTVPAQESYMLRQTPYSVAREVVALWVYYLRPLWQAT